MKKVFGMLVMLLAMTLFASVSMAGYTGEHGSGPLGIDQVFVQGVDMDVMSIAYAVGIETAIYKRNVPSVPTSHGSATDYNNWHD